MSYIVMDVGGTNVRYSFANELNPKTLIYYKRPFLKMNNPKAEVEKNICSIIGATPDHVQGIGISLAAIMDRETQKVKTWPNNPCWNNYDLVEHLNSKYNVPIVVEDDANCGAIGEYTLSSLKKNMAYITIGTGIGCGFILNGSLFIGENGFAGELGHVWIGNDNEVLCSCGNQGCFQSFASGPAILKEYNQDAKTSLEFLEQVYERYLQGDPIAIQCLSNMINNISMVIYNLVMCLDISLFVIGGGVSNMGAEFISSIEKKVNSRLDFYKRRVFVRHTQLGEFSGVFGALMLLKSRIT